MSPKALNRSKVKTRRAKPPGSLYRYMIEVEYDGIIVGEILSLDTDQVERHYQSVMKEVEAGSDDPILHSRVVQAADMRACPYIWRGLDEQGTELKHGGGVSEDEAMNRLLEFVQRRLKAHGKL